MADSPSPAGRRGSLLLNLVAGLSVLSWACLGLRHSWLTSGEIGVVRASGSALHLLAGCLFLVRRPLHEDGSNAQLLMAVPSFLVGGVAFRLAPEPERWGIAAVSIFLLGSVVTMVSLLTLGRSFAVLPARREVVARGIYRWLRHPAYAGECLLVTAMVVATLKWHGPLLLAVFLPCMVMRLRAEEQVMGGSVAYGLYCRQVRWRLLPGVW